MLRLRVWKSEWVAERPPSVIDALLPNGSDVPCAGGRHRSGEAVEGAGHELQRGHIDQVEAVPGDRSNQDVAGLRNGHEGSHLVERQAALNRLRAG